MKIVLNNDDGSLFAKFRAAEFTPTFWWRDAKRRYFAGHRTLANGDAGRHHVYSRLCLRAVFSYTDAARGLLHYPSRSWRTCDTAPKVGTPRATELENKLKPKTMINAIKCFRATSVDFASSRLVNRLGNFPPFSPFS